MVTALSSGALALPPFTTSVQWTAQDPQEPARDGTLKLRWEPHGLDLSFAFRLKTRWTELELQQLAREGPRQGQHPLVVLPYLSDDHLAKLQKHGLSGLDLCGNCLLCVPPNVFVLRTGAKNRFPAPRATPTVYHSHNVSSLVPRVLLSQPLFTSMQDVLSACRARMMPPTTEPPPLSLATVSRTIAQMKMDLVVTRHGRMVKLLDPIRLLEGLERSFHAPVVTATHIGKTDLQGDARSSALELLRASVRMVVTGRGAASLYTGLAVPERLQLYVSDLPRVQAALRSRETAAFPNIELLETQDEAVYFDAREESGARWASPLQAYLELSRAGARERDVATYLRTHLLQAAAAAEKAGA